MMDECWLMVLGGGELDLRSKRWGLPGIDYVL